MALRFRRKRNINVMRVGIKIGITVIALWVSGFLVNVIGDVMNSSASPFYDGLELIGWTITDGAHGTTQACWFNVTNDGSVNNCITDTSGNGVLAIVGLIAIAFLVFEFVDIGY